MSAVHSVHIIMQCDSAATRSQYIYMYIVSVSLYIVHCHYTATYTYIDMHVVQYIYSVATQLFTVYN